MNKKLYKSTKDSKISGVCGGIAEYFNIDPVLIRITFVFLIFFGLMGLILYIVLAIVMPKQPIEGANYETDEASSVKKDFKDIGKDLGDMGKEFGTKMEDLGKDIGENMKNFGREIEDQVEGFSKNSKTGKFSLSIIGTLFIGLGVSILLSKFCPYFRFEFYFPSILIICGIILILFSFKSKS